jgi:predicted Zn finger-like uncharacterized protein
LTVVQCPGCNSKFRIDLKALQKKTVKMRCSVCSHVFSYDPATGPVIEQDFDSVIGTHDGQLEESFSQPSLEELAGEITESTEPSEPGTEESHEASIEVEPESVIREIDSILGTGSEVAEGDADVSKKPSRDGSTLKMIISVVLIILVFLGISLWIMKDSLIPLLKQDAREQSRAVLEKGPFFSIPEETVTYELLSNNSEGAVLVVKGVIRKLTSKPLKSVLVQARVYDRNNNLIESRNAYAGIIPESDELIRRKGSDIETLLSAEPRTLGTLSTSPDIPFAVAFFGRPAREGFSFQVEVKEFHWK